MEKAERGNGKGDHKGDNHGDEKILYELYSREEMSQFESMKIKGGAKLEGISEFWMMACLRARKYDTTRAIELAIKYMEWRAAFDVDGQKPRNNELLLTQLKTGMIRVPGSKDKFGRYMIVLDLSKHNPDKWKARDTVRCVHYNLELLLHRHVDAQVKGIVIVNDMSNVTITNIDTAVPREIFNALSSRFPIRLGGIYVVNPPWFFRMFFPIVKSVMKKKFQERLKIIKGFKGLKNFFDSSQLLIEHGGEYRYDHDAAVRAMMD